MQRILPIKGAAAKQIVLAEHNEANVLLALGKFGWLSQSQIATFCGLSISTVRHIIRRMTLANLIWSETYLNSSNVKAFALTRKGAVILRSDERSRFLEKISSFYSSRGFLSRFEHQYHRHLANEFLVNLLADNVKIGCHVVSYIKSEHEIQAIKNVANTIFQCVPDALAITDYKTLIMIEIENSSRGISQHEGSMTHWLSVLAEKYHHEGHYSDSLRTLFRELIRTDEYGDTVFPEFKNVEQVFVCRTEAIFRNIWRKVDRVTKGFPSIQENICYFVLSGKQRWHNIFEGAEALFHEEPETIERVNSGAYRYKYNLERRKQIVEDSKVTEFTRDRFAKLSGISVSTLNRWSRELK